MRKTNVGRKKKFETSKLLEICDSYFKNNSVHGQINATLIAKYATEVLGFENIDYYHFTRDKDVKKLIDDYNNYNVNLVKYDQTTFISLNPDTFMERFKSEPKIAKILLRQFSDRYQSLNQTTIELEKKCLVYENKLSKIEYEIKKLKSENHELREKNKLYRAENISLSNYKNFTDKVKMFEYLKSKGLIQSLDEENLKLLLSNTGLYSTNHFNHVEHDIGDSYVENELNNEINNQQINEKSLDVSKAIKTLENKLR